MTAVPSRAMEGAPEWWYANAGAPEGPVSFERLGELAASGRLKPTDLVWCKGMPDWVAAGTVDGLCAPVAAPAEALPPAIPPQAPAVAPFPQPPSAGSTCTHCGTGTLQASHGYRSSAPFVVIGYLLLVPCVLGLIAGIVALVASQGNTAFPSPGASASDPCGIGSSAGTACCSGLCGALAAAALVGGLGAIVLSLLGIVAGRSLTRRIPVLRCTECGKVTKLA